MLIEQRIEALEKEVAALKEKVSKLLKKRKINWGFRTKSDT